MNRQSTTSPVASPRSNQTRRIWFAALLLALAGHFAPNSLAGVSPHEPERVVLRLAPIAGALVDVINNAFGTSVVEAFPGRDDTYLLQVPMGTDLDQLLSDLNALPIVLYAERNWRNDMTLEGSAFRSYATGGMDAAPLTDQRWIEVLGLADAHLLAQGTGTRIAVLDTGIDGSHALFAGQISNDGFDYVDNDGDPSPSPNGSDDDGDGLMDEGEGHGTHVAGIVSQVAPGAAIIPYRVLDSDGIGNDWNTAKAIHAAIEQQSDAINMSLMSVEPSQLLSDLIEEATFTNALVASAAGNQAADLMGYPAAEACSLAVAASDGVGRAAPFTSYGAWVSLAAPGISVYSAIPGGNYGWWSGSSQSSPFAAAAGVLLNQQFPALTAVQRADILSATTFVAYLYANSLEAGPVIPQEGLGAGMLNLFAAVDIDLGGGLPMPSPAPVEVWCSPEPLGFDASLDAGGAAAQVTVGGLLNGNLNLPLQPTVHYDGNQTLRDDSDRVAGLSATLAGEPFLSVDGNVVAVRLRRPSDPAQSYAGVTGAGIDLSLTPLVPLLEITADSIVSRAQIGGSCGALSPSGSVELVNAVVTSPLGGSISLPANPPADFEVDLSVLPGDLTGITLTLNDQAASGDGVTQSMISVTGINLELNVDVIGVLSLTGTVDLAASAAEIDCP